MPINDRIDTCFDSSIDDCRKPSLVTIRVLEIASTNIPIVVRNSHSTADDVDLPI
jgi:hypothetical protein